MWNRKRKELNKSFVIFAALAEVTEFAGGTERYYSDLVQNRKFIPILVTRIALAAHPRKFTKVNFYPTRGRKSQTRTLNKGFNFEKKKLFVLFLPYIKRIISPD